MPILEGRDVEDADWQEPRRVVWINEQFARVYFDGEAAQTRTSRLLTHEQKR